jgi:misacylated tRNA(Ala) deacylase
MASVSTGDHVGRVEVVDASSGGRTHRLDWADPTLREWEAVVLWSDPGNPEAGIVLDRSAFYPGGGGQPPDEGVLIWQGVQTRILGTRKGEDLFLLPDPSDPIPPVGSRVRGAVEDERRTLLMRTHSGLHVLCGTVFRDFGARVTGGNMKPGEARLDFDLPLPPPNFKADLEAAVNHEIDADRRIIARVLPREQALADPAVIRTVAVAPPEDTPELRLIDIEGLDVQADGGTHVASTRQIGRVQVTKVENKGRQNRRVRIRLDG